MATTRWVPPATTLAAGVVSAGQLGQLSPVLTSISRDLQLSPAMGGLAISLTTFVAAIGAAPLALWTRRRPPSQLVALGLGLSALVEAATALAVHTAGGLLALRGAGGCGYLLVVVAGPNLLVEQVDPRHRSWALALWGSCIPAGLAITAGAGGSLAMRLGWRGWFAALALASALLAGAVVVTARSAPMPTTPAAGALTWRALRAPLCLAAGFGLVASISVVVASLLPTYLDSARGLSLAEAGSITSLVAIASVPGSIVAGVLLRRGLAPTVVGLSALGCPAAAAVGLSAAPLTVAVIADIVLVFVAGLAVGATYGALPAVAAAPGVMIVANGMLVQFGSLGTLIAPPIFAAATDLRHWSVVAILLIVPAVAGFALLAAATTRRKQTNLIPVVGACRAAVRRWRRQTARGRSPRP